MNQRQCSDCTLCCKILGVADLKKPAREYCPHCEINHGCKIYESRPKECVDFRCAWLLGSIPEELKPSKTGVMITSLAMDLRNQGYLEPTKDYVLVYPENIGDEKKEPVKSFLNNLLKNGIEIILVDGEKKMLMKWGSIDDGC